jgi:hypothetical protein
MLVQEQTATSFVSDFSELFFRRIRLAKTQTAQR